MLGGDRSARNVWIAVASTILFFGVLAVVVVRSPGWPEIKQQFFNGQEFAVSFPLILRKFTRNIFIFCVAEVLVLTLALVLAVLRSLPGPVFTPLRIFSATYTDLFRGVPTILVIVMLGFGAPALNLVAAARSLGFSRWQSMRYVVLPQAIRRVIPPLLNDFIGLQKDSALVYVLGVVESLNQATIIQAGDFNFTPYVALSVIYIAITIPQARFVDRMVARDQRRRQAGATL
ncbi:MAG: ABC transporter permease subunit [Actinobacteria bacterium]|nr:MAG: ABC transporter permease subunit [Actinomycetota bacterium]